MSVSIFLDKGCLAILHLDSASYWWVCWPELVSKYQGKDFPLISLLLETPFPYSNALPSLQCNIFLAAHLAMSHVLYLEIFSVSVRFSIDHSKYWALSHAKHCVKCFFTLTIFLWNRHNYYPILQIRKLKLKWNNLSKVLELVRARAEIWSDKLSCSELWC